MRLPSEIGFVSLLQYSPRGMEDLAKRSRAIRDAIKRDSYISIRRSTGPIESMRAIQYYATVMKAFVEHGHFPFLGQMFGTDVILVPVPGSAPLVNKSALWSPMSICKALKAEGMCGEILPILERTQAVQKSAFAAPGGRPGPEQHCESVAVTGSGDLPMFSSRRIVLVDDFVTRGSTFLGLYPHIEAAFPSWNIQCFAMVRTQSFGTLDAIWAPVEGKITYRNGRPWRSP